MREQKTSRKKRHRRKHRSALRGLLVLLAILALILAALLFLSHKKQEKIDALCKETESVSAPLPVPGEAEEAAADIVPEDVTEEKIDTPVKETEDTPLPDTTLIFTGDVLLADTPLYRYADGGLSAILSEDLTETFRAADILMINEEFPFSTRGEQAIDKEYTFRTDPSFVSAFVEMGVDIAGLANNHILDFGTDALLDSVSTLDQAGILYAGAGADRARAEQLITVEVNGKKLGFLAASRVWPDAFWAAGDSRPGVFGTYDPTRLLEKIRNAKEEGCDFVTVFVHWGIERSTTPEDYQRSMAAQYAQAGADLVIGMHPHVLQGIEYFDDTPVFYSLGNFIFGGRAYPTAAVQVQLPPEGEPVVTVIPCTVSGGYTSRAEGEEAAAIYENLNSLSFSAALDENGVLHPVSP